MAPHDLVGLSVYWDHVIAHGSDAELAGLIAFSRNDKDVRVPPADVRRGETALVWRRSHGCADIPDNPFI